MPWGHLGFGYVLYTLFVHAVYRRRPADGPTLALAFGTQFPDLVDKPLAWAVQLLPSGRSLAHSLFVAAVVVAVVTVVAARRGYPAAGPAFGIGYLSHLVGDSYTTLLGGRFSEATFLLWPLYPITEPDDVDEVLVDLVSLPLGPELAVTLVLGVCVFALWVVDGRPGLGPVTSLTRECRGRLAALFD
ncbi:metal-dependent hydrolase [Haloprofundus salinisoli]|uniref:metal-dependent hydrolase n=1 Tax=Haloprofundus salinisoli TaxID=2876193 RepID=UPI001CCE9A0E|nr:metal-dependent hydrolase [Haloprofundus salinisoli]